MESKSTTSQIVRKSFTLMVIRLVIFELILESIYIAWRFGIDGFPISPEMKISLHSYTTVVFIIVTISQIIILLRIVLQWMNESYELKNNELTIYEGVLSKISRSYPYNQIQTITVSQSMFGRLLNFGTIVLTIPTLSQDLVLNEIPKPHLFAEQIKNYLPKSDQSALFLRRK
ncbi:PH domain-containing protein [Candidatus Roizmanbacteria bacterium]|nr:MAG: PH domain-containing protein [Candidatus Roizmanbacteria bacterium]